jgi:serine/threonine protein kinase
MLATDAETGRQVAVKEVYINNKESMEYLERMSGIIEKIREMNLENILNVHRILIKDSQAFICQETTVATVTDLLEQYESLKLSEIEIAAIVRAVIKVRFLSGF